MTASPAPGTFHLDLYDVACLAGGFRRMVDTALVALVESGRVRVHPGGELSVTRPQPRHAVEAAVLELVGSPHRRSVATIRWRAGGDPRLTAVAERLTVDGLVSRRPRPGFLGGDRPFLTRAGRRTLRRLRADVPMDRVADGSSAMLVALSGGRAMADAEQRARLFDPPVPSPRRSSRFWNSSRVPAHDSGTTWAGTWREGGGGWGGGGFDDGGGFDGGGGGDG